MTKNIEKIWNKPWAGATYLCLDVAGDVAADVLSAEVDVAADGEGHTADVHDDEGHRVDRPAVAGAGLVEGVPDEGGRVREDLLRVVEANSLVEALAAGGVRRGVRRLERDGAGRSGSRRRSQEQEGSDRGDMKLHSCAVGIQLSCALLVLELATNALAGKKGGGFGCLVSLCTLSVLK